MGFLNINMKTVFRGQELKVKELRSLWPALVLCVTLGSTWPTEASRFCNLLKHRTWKRSVSTSSSSLMSNCLCWQLHSRDCFFLYLRAFAIFFSFHKTIVFISHNFSSTSVNSPEIKFWPELRANTGKKVLVYSLYKNVPPPSTT